MLLEFAFVVGAVVVAVAVAVAAPASVAAAYINNNEYFSNFPNLF